jgi:hypothetical protein
LHGKDGNWARFAIGVSGLLLLERFLLRS